MFIESGDAIQPSHFLSSPSSPAFNLSQHQGLFKWVSSSHQVAKLLEFQQTLNRIISEKSISRSIIIKMVRTTKKKNLQNSQRKTVYNTSVQFSRSVMSDSLQPHESQHARLPCPSQTPGVYSNSCPSSRGCHPAISSSVVPFSSCPQSLPASGSFPMSQLFAWDGQSTVISASASVLPMNTQDWSPLGWTGWISLLSKGLSRVFSNTTVQKHQFFSTQLSSQSNSHIHTWPLEKP